MYETILLLATIAAPAPFPKAEPPILPIWLRVGSAWRGDYDGDRYILCFHKDREINIFCLDTRRLYEGHWFYTGKRILVKINGFTFEVWDVGDGTIRSSTLMSIRLKRVPFPMHMFPIRDR